MTTPWVELVVVGGIGYRVAVTTVAAGNGVIGGWTLTLCDVVCAEPVFVTDADLGEARARMQAAIESRVAGGAVGDYHMEQMVVLASEDFPKEVRAFVIGRYQASYVLSVHPADLPNGDHAFPACVIAPPDAVRAATDSEVEQANVDYEAEEGEG